VSETVTNQQRPRASRRSFDTRKDIDSAVSDFANRMIALRVYSWIPLVGRGVSGDLEAARRSFDTSISAIRAHRFPVQLALSAQNTNGSASLRGLFVRGGGGAELPASFFDAIEVFTDTSVFVGLEYRDLLAKYEARLESKPDDDATRVELGRTPLKCGLYDDAAKTCSRHPAIHPCGLSLHEAAVAPQQGGPESAARPEATPSADPNERARSRLWLTAQKMGGYPAFVPAAHRMQMRVGYVSPPSNLKTRPNRPDREVRRGIVSSITTTTSSDVMIASTHGGCSLYRNNGDGTFTDVSVGSGLDSCLNTLPSSPAITITTATRLIHYPARFYVGEACCSHNGRRHFYRCDRKGGAENLGPGVTASWPTTTGRQTRPVVANNLGGVFDRKTPNRLFHNNGDGTFPK
jgi:hypothetical protein